MSASLVSLRRTLTIDCSALIDVLIERFQNPEFNTTISHYFNCQYADILTVLPQNTKALLPPEDQFFIYLFFTVLLPSARKKVCLQRQQIRMGPMNVEDARKSIPRKDLELAVLKAKYKKADIREDNNNTMG